MGNKDTTIGRTLHDTYRIERLLGKGGMGGGPQGAGQGPRFSVRLHGRALAAFCLLELLDGSAEAGPAEEPLALFKLPGRVCASQAGAKKQQPNHNQQQVYVG